jgi:heme-degrading monooxygenase HmoA
VTDATRELLKLGPLVEQLVAQPDNVDLRYRVAVITWKWKSREDGEKWLRSVLEYDPHHAGTHATLVDHYEAANGPVRAESHRKASKRESDDTSGS